MRKCQSKPRALNSKLTSVLRIVAENLNGNVTVQSLATACGMSPSSFRALIHCATGCSPKQYIEHARMRRAEHLLSSNSALSVKQVMAAVGISDASHFSRDFKKIFGAPPSEYRRKCDKDAPKIQRAREEFCFLCPLSSEIAKDSAKPPTESARQSRPRDR